MPTDVVFPDVTPASPTSLNIAVVPGIVLPITSSVDPRNAQAGPGARIIESEDFLY